LAPRNHAREGARPEGVGGTNSTASAGAARDVRKPATRYKVHKGDTLDQIARVYGVTVDRLADRNQLKKSQPSPRASFSSSRWGPDLSRFVPYIYLDNAATSLPKPPGVAKAVADAILRAGNPGRSGHALSIRSARDLFSARERLAELFGCADSSGSFSPKTPPSR